MNFDNLVGILEGRIRDSKKISHEFDVPMFSVFLDKESFDIKNDKQAKLAWILSSDIMKKCFEMAYKSITKKGFPSMHVNAIIIETDSMLPSNQKGATVMGYAHGNPISSYKHDNTIVKNAKKLKSIYINYKLLYGLANDPERCIPMTVATIIHEWSHAFMFNQGKEFRDAVNKYHDALINSQVDKVPNTDFDKKNTRNVLIKIKKDLLKLYRKYATSQSSSVDLSRMDDSIYNIVYNSLYELGDKQYFITTEEINNIIDEVGYMFRVYLNLQDPQYTISKVWNSLNKLNIVDSFFNKIKEPMGHIHTKKESTRDQISKLVKFTGSYGLTKPDETWATAVTDFVLNKLHPEHLKRILKIMSGSYGLDTNLNYKQR